MTKIPHIREEEALQHLHMRKRIAVNHGHAAFSTEKSHLQQVHSLESFRFEAGAAECGPATFYVLPELISARAWGSPLFYSFLHCHRSAFGNAEGLLTYCH